MNSFRKATTVWVSLMSLLAISSVYAGTNHQTTFTQAVPMVTQPMIQTVPVLAEKAQFLNSQSPEIQQAMRLYQKTGQAPIIKTQGYLEFPYGDTQPIIACKPLDVCDIALEPGEVITGVNVGDSARWDFAEAFSGTGSSRQMHISFKPKDFNISTNVVIYTTRRTYNLALVSDPVNYAREVRFYYPDDIEAAWQQFDNKALSSWQNQHQTTIASISPTIDLEKIDDNYSLEVTSGGIFNPRPLWTPIRIFNDGGQQVFIEMPPNMQRTDAPVLFVLNSDGKQALVNYRVQGNWYIVDDFFKQAVMVAGVGHYQQRILITYNG